MGSIDQEMVIIVCMGILVLFIILGVAFMILWKRMNDMKRRYDAMVNHGEVENLEQVIAEIQNKLSAIQGNQAAQEVIVQQLKNKQSMMKGNVTMQRYNAFNETGSDQSFSIAIVDDQQNGLVFTAIHGREETYSYAKPLIKGESKYPLSPEERKVISSALSM